VISVGSEQDETTQVATTTQVMRKQVMALFVKFTENWSYLIEKGDKHNMASDRIRY